MLKINECSHNEVTAFASQRSNKERDRVIIFHVSCCQNCHEKAAH